MFPYFAVHESLQLQLSDAKLAVLLSQAPAGLGKVDLCSPHHAHILRRLSQLQLVCPLQLEVLETSDKKKKKETRFIFKLACHIFPQRAMQTSGCQAQDLMRMLSSSLFICMSFFSWFS